MSEATKQKTAKPSKSAMKYARRIARTCFLENGLVSWMSPTKAAAVIDRAIEADPVRAALLDACETVLNHVEDETVKRVNGQCTLCYSHRKILRAAIAAARGTNQ
jgi:hypothetical protein